MKAILRISFFGGLVLAGFYFLLDRYHFPSFPIHIIVVPGGMMFAINGFLKPVENRKHYNYMVGVGIGFLYAILAFIIAYAAYHLYSLGSITEWSFSDYYNIVTTAIINSLLLILVSAFIVPTIYLAQKKEPKKNQTDVLDEDL